jgi:D-alanyl-D-alanine carboxypeptidase/D-alanyl-D-alanine-endopeptidase (penicillin-binding protein 4)
MNTLKNRFNNSLFISLLSIFYLLSGCSSVRKNIRNHLHNESLKNSFHGLLIIDADSEKELFNTNADKYFTPASNTKLVTFYTGIKLLPKNIPSLHYVVANDTLFIEGTGDPSWLHPYLNDSTAIRWLKNQKNIALYTGNSDEPRFGPGWAWEDYDTYFSPEKSTLPLYGNVVTLSKSEMDSLQVSPIEFLEYTAIKESAFKREEYQNRFYIDPEEQDTLEVPFIVNDSLTKLLLESVLQQKISLSDHFPDQPKQTLFGMETDSIYKYMLFKSDNFLAEQLLMIASSTLSDTLGTKRAIDYMLENGLSNLKQQPRWVDGSGLSRYNLFTPRSFVQILQKLHQEVPEDRLFALMPMWGSSNTVAKWDDPETEPFLFAKSGSVGNNYNLSGYVRTKSGKLLIFSFMNNHFRTPSQEIRNTIYTTLKELYQRY